MATKDNFSLLFRKKQNIVIDNDQYNNFTLNENHQVSSDAFSKHSKGVITERRKVLDYADLSKVFYFSINIVTKLMRRTAAPKKLSDFTKDLQTKKESQTWNKSTIDLSPCIVNNGSGKEDKLKKEKALSASTLSLYIEAYENSNEANFCGVTKEELKKNDLIKKRLISKQLDFDLTAVIQNPFEFSRQQENGKALNPEIAQYRASQRLLNPNLRKHQAPVQQPFHRNFGRTSSYCIMEESDSSQISERKENADIIEESDSSQISDRKENHDIIEESDSSQVFEQMEVDINEIHSSPDSKSQRSHSRYDKFTIESDSDTTVVMESDDIQIDESDPIASQDNAISEALQYLSYRPNIVETHNKRTVSPDIFKSPVKRKKYVKNSFVKKEIVEEDLLDIKDYDDDFVEESPSQSDVGEYEQPDDDDDDDFNGEENEEENGEEEEEEDEITMENENNESMQTEYPDAEWEYNFEDSESDPNDDGEDDEDEEDTDEDEETNMKSDNEDLSDNEEEDQTADPEIDYIKPDKPNTPKPKLITANVISTETHDGLIYTELDNEIVIITPAKQRVKDQGSLTYEEGTGVKFIGPSIKNQPPRTFIACPQMAKEKLF